MEQRQILDQALTQARTALSQDPDGDLPLAARNALWLALGAPQEDEQGNPTGAGWRRRVRLSILTVQHLLPVWQQEHGDDPGPQNMLDLAEQVVKGQADRDAARSTSDDYWTMLSDFGFPEKKNEPPQVLPVCVGVAACRVVRTACVDYQMLLRQAEEQKRSQAEAEEGDVEGDKEIEDGDRDAWGWDESFFAAMACSGGTPWTPGSSTENRRAFWQWYLDQAVPEAYASVTE